MIDAILGFIIFAIIGSFIKNLSNAGKSQKAPQNQTFNPREIFKEFLDQNNPVSLPDTGTGQIEYETNNSEYNDPGYLNEYPAESPFKNAGSVFDNDEIQVNSGFTPLNTVAINNTAAVNKEQPRNAAMDLDSGSRKSIAVIFSKESIRNGIILSEILQPPKARKRFKI